MTEPNGVTAKALVGAIIQNESEQRTYRIGDLAREFGVTLRSLRFYEDKGLLKPIRRGTTRIYSENDRRQLRIILLWKLLGFTLIEAQAFLAVLNDPTKGSKRVTVALDQFDRQRPLLLERQREIAEALQALDLAVDELSDGKHLMAG